MTFLVNRLQLLSGNKMKNYLIGLVVLLLSSCSSPKTIIAENVLEVSN